MNAGKSEGSAAGKQMKKLRIISVDQPDGSLEFWLSRTPEERLSAVEILREQCYAIQGFKEIPRLVKAVRIVEKSQ